MDSSNTLNACAPKLTQAELDQQFLDAARNGQADLMTKLIKEGAASLDILDPKENGHVHRATKLAVENGHLNSVNILLPYLKSNPIYYYEALAKAAENGHLNVLDALFPYLNTLPVPEGANYFKKTAIYCAASNGHAHVINSLAEYFKDVEIFKSSIGESGCSPY